ncbi:MAG: TonB-dependent receptor, partial [Tannerellaceae bacterium]|nr:TonB-dependent receptor [Tannerellaceae bacterium]
EWNVGLDMGLFQNRIRIGMDYYRRRNFDLIGMVTTQGVGGQGSKWLNFAAMRGYGYELSVSSANVVVPDFRWTTDVVFWTGRTKVTTLESDSYALDLISGYGYVREGYPVRSLFSIEYLGLDNKGSPILNGYNAEDYTLFDTQQTDHLVYEGPTDPTGGGSLENHFRWRNFSMNVYMTYSFGNKVRLNPVFSHKYTDYGSMPVGMSDRWKKTEGQHTDVPSLLIYEGHDSSNSPYRYMAYNYSTARVANGGFVRLKDVSVMYDFPKRFMERWKPGHLSLKFQATNLCLLYSDKKLHGQDPEYHHSGGISAPVPRQFTFTLKLGL